MTKRVSFSGASSRSQGVKALLIDELRAGRLRPVYVLEGSDQHRIDQAAEFIRKKALGPGSESFNDHVLDAETVGWAGVLRQAYSYPMFGGNQVVWARHGDHLKPLEKDPSEAALVEYMKSPLESTILIISGEHFDARRSWMKTAKDRGYHVPFPAPTGTELLAWIRKAGSKAGLSLDEEAVRLLADLIGSDLQVLQGEVEKLALFEKSQGKPIINNQLPMLVLEQAERDTFSLTEVVGLARGPQMLKNWNDQTTLGRSFEELTPLLFAHLRRAVMVSFCLAEGMTQAECSATMNINAWMLRTKLAPFARQLDDRTRRQLLRACLACDAALKSRPLQPGVVCEQLLATISSLDSAL